MLVLAILLVATAVARADDAWQAGVSPENQATAKQLFAEGNELFARKAHAAAFEKYREAIRLWDHPLIRFNMAVTEIQLDRILEAADDLDAALRFGEAPFTAELYQQATNYQSLIRGRVGEIEAVCDQPDVVVTLDGRRWFSGVGKHRQRVLVGEHAVVGERKGYMTVSRRVIVAGAMTAETRIALLPIQSVETLHYPSPRWLPYTVGGAGVALALGGLGIWYAGRNQMDQYETHLAQQCAAGCSLGLDANASERALANDRDSAQLKGKVGLTMMIGGGLVATTGVVWVVLNRPTRVLPKVEVAPGPGGVITRAAWRF